MGSCSGKVVPVDSPDNEAKPMEIDRVEGRGGWKKGKGLKGQSLSPKAKNKDAFMAFARSFNTLYGIAKS